MASASTSNAGTIIGNNEIQEVVKPQENIKNAKFWFYVLLSIIPDLFFVSFSIYIIKMRANDYVRCEIKDLENTSWSFHDIKEISQTEKFSNLWKMDNRDVLLDSVNVACISIFSIEAEPLRENLDEFIKWCTNKSDLGSDIHNWLASYDTLSRGYHKECSVYKFDYSKVANMSFENARKYINLQKTRTIVLCKKFVISEMKDKNYATKYQKEFADYCQNLLEYDIVYDSLASLFFILSCVLILPFADIYGRKRILNFGWHLACVSTFCRILSMNSGRNIFATVLLNAAYPLLKLATQIIIFEISNDNVLPATFMFTFMGTSVCLTIFGMIPTLEWSLMKLLVFLTFLVLPILQWFLPESSIWLMSKNIKGRRNESKPESLMNANGIHLKLLNERLNSKVIKKHFQELKSTNFSKYVCLSLVSIGIGSSNYYSFSKPKFLYNYFEQKWTRVFNYLNLMHGVIISTLSIYTFGSKISLAIFLITSTFSYVYLYLFTSESPYDVKFIVMVFFVEIFTSCANFVYQFYLAEIFPISHRCTYTGIFNAIVIFGFLIISCIRLQNVFFAVIITALANLSGCVTLIMLIKTSESNHPQLLHFVNSENV